MTLLQNSPAESTSGSTPGTDRLPRKAVTALAILGLFEALSVVGVFRVLAVMPKLMHSDRVMLGWIIAVTVAVMIAMAIAGWLVAAKRAILPLRVLVMAMLVLTLIGAGNGVGLAFLVNVATLGTLFALLNAAEVKEFFGRRRSAR